MSSPGELGWVMGPRASRITQRGMQARIDRTKWTTGTYINQPRKFQDISCARFCGVMNYTEMLIVFMWVLEV